jgi:hypothetical protein
MVDQGIRSFRISYATSVAVILFICFVFSILYQIFVLRHDTSGRTSRMSVDDHDGIPAHARLCCARMDALGSPPS